MALSQALLGVMLLVEFYIPCIMWEAAAFRPQIDPGFTYRIHDLASIMFIAGEPMNPPTKRLTGLS